jgi:hypothetical protein
VKDASTDDLLRLAFDREVDAGQTDECFDAETAAAWLDNGLAADIRAKARVHVASCHRCQSLLAALVETETEASEWSRPARWSGRATWLPALVAAAAIVIVAVTLPTDPVAPGDALSPAPERQTGAGAADAVAANEAAPAAELNRAEQPALRAPAPAATAQSASRDQAAAATADLEAREASAPRWRLDDGRIQRLADDGTWTPVVSLIPAELTGLDSPSPDICWVVGRAGVVLLTTNGRTWRRVEFPETTNLSAVVAQDGLAAIVMTSDGRRFATRDGGRIWTLVQDF